MARTVVERDPFIEAIAKRVVDFMCETVGVRRLTAVLSEGEPGEAAAFVRDDQPLKSSPAGDEPAIMSVPEFCAWARVSRSTLYQMWTDGTGPKFFKAGAATRISRQAAVQWLLEREAAAGAD